MEVASSECSKGQSRAILAIGAHPDDIELGCGGTLAKLGAQGVPVRALIFSKGRRGVINDEDRSTETRVALGQIGITDIHVYDFEDTKLWLNVTDLISVIEEHVRELNPFRVYTMFHQDRHQDHRAVHEASTVACRSVDQLLGYETPAPTPILRRQSLRPSATRSRRKCRPCTVTRARANAFTCRKSKSAARQIFEEPRSASDRPRGSFHTK